MPDRPESDAGAAWLDEFQPTPDENRLYAEAAAVAGLEVAHWVRQVLNRTAAELLLAGKD